MKKSYVYLLTTFMLWGSLYVVSQFVLGKIPTFTVAMFRYLIAFIALSLISLKSEKEKIEKSDYKYFFIMGFIGYFISVDCQLLGTKIAGGSMASLINSLNPVIISVMAMIILNEKLEINLPEDEVKEFATALVRARGTIKYCSICGNFTETDPCPICSNPSRDKSVICVVEQPKDIMTMEKVKEFNGTYHVLHGNLSPMQGRGPQDIKIRELVARMNADVKEVIIATNPNVEGEATAMYISRILRPLEVKVTRIASGLPVGGDLEYADEVTLSKALEGRKEI